MTLSDEHAFARRSALRVAQDAAEDPARRMAHLLVALTSADDKKAEVSAALARKRTAAIVAKYQPQVVALWDAASEESLAFLNLILKNNPLKSPQQILARPDVQEALREPYETAAEKSEELLRKAWAESEADSVQMLKGEFKLWKEGWKGHAADLGLLDSLVSDLHKNAQAMRTRYRTALISPQKDLKASLSGIAKDASRRAGYSLSVAVWGAATSVRDSAYARAGLNKMWVSRMDEKTCTHCVRLHGKVVGPGEEFPKDTPGAAFLKVYGGKLLGPPRHPNCRCVIVGTKLQKN